MKDENTLNEGLEKPSEEKDYMNWISCLALCKRKGCPPSLANLNFAVLMAYYRVTAFFMEPLKSARVE